MTNFAWKHQLVNIHGVMMVDILHQLLKGIIMNMIEWTQILIDDITPIKRKRRFDEALIEEAPIAAQLDHRFDVVPSFSDLQHFSKFSKITQWSGNEQKDILRIFVPVVAPFLTGKCPAAMLCVRAICDFATMRCIVSTSSKGCLEKVDPKTTKPVNPPLIFLSGMS